MKEPLMSFGTPAEKCNFSFPKAQLKPVMMSHIYYLMKITWTLQLQSCFLDRFSILKCWVLERYTPPPLNMRMSTVIFLSSAIPYFVSLLWQAGAQPVFTKESVLVCANSHKFLTKFTVIRCSDSFLQQKNSKKLCRTKNKRHPAVELHY